MLIRDIEETSQKYGRNPWRLPIEDLLELAIVNINKPAGPTSHLVSAWVKQILGARKAGHSGTLDPGVTGVLPVAINSATKIIPALLKAGKEYVGVLHLHSDVPKKKILEAVHEFEGDIIQLPPAKSAVKRRSRKRRVYYFQVLEVKEREVLFKTAVEAGTYIRKLCHDMGLALGTGANMKELIRTRAGPFTEKTTITLQELSEAMNYYKETKDESLLRKCLRPVEDGILLLPKIYVKDSAVNSLTYGAHLGVAGISKLEANMKEGELIALLTLKGELIGLGLSLKNAADIEKDWEGNVAKVERVVIKQNVYPKTW